MTRKNAYVVCAKPRVVLFGYATPTEIRKAHPTLTNVRMCVYWSTGVHGVLGLAATGPLPDCRVTPAVSALTVREEIEATMICSQEAIAAWEREPWQ